MSEKKVTGSSFFASLPQSLQGVNHNVSSKVNKSLESIEEVLCILRGDKKENFSANKFGKVCRFILELAFNDKKDLNKAVTDFAEGFNDKRHK